jgi:hypothetical protein
MYCLFICLGLLGSQPGAGPSSVLVHHGSIVDVDEDLNQDVKEVEFEYIEESQDQNYVEGTSVYPHFYTLFNFLLFSSAVQYA